MNLMKDFPIISGINKLYQIKGFLSAFTADNLYPLRVADYKLKLYKQLIKYYKIANMKNSAMICLVCAGPWHKLVAGHGRGVDGNDFLQVLHQKLPYRF